MKTTIPLAVFAVLLPLFAGCASSGYEKAGKTTTSLQTTAAGIDHALLPLDNVQLALTDLMSNPQPNITAQYERYNLALTKLESIAADIKDHAAKMQGEGDAYFKNWDADLAKIKNEDIHTRSLDRKNAVTAQFEALRVSYVQADTLFAPYLSDLKDIRTALGTDLTAGGIASVRPLALQSNRKVQPVRDALIRLSSDFKSLGVAISPTTPAE